ncbi:MAG: ABC transporter ATP-binding protein [Lawsonibacter sp.]
MTNCIEIKGLCKSYPDFSLQNIDLTLPGGTIMGLIGENGAGKTTTIKCILNLIRRDAGEITLLGRDNLREERAAKAGVGVVLDECVFHDALRPRDLERILAPVYPTWDNGLYRDYLDKFRLPGKNLIKTFSRGMKMKLSLAAALAHRPQLLILDEATAGLDPVVRDEILDEFLNFICDEDHAILISSHITSDRKRRRTTSPTSTRAGSSCPSPRTSCWTVTAGWAAPPATWPPSSPATCCGCGEVPSAVRASPPTGTCSRRSIPA